MKHVAAHRWADAFAGTLDAAAVDAMDAHAATCARCARARDRVQRASQSFPVLRAQTAPELPWESIRTRVGWSVAADKRSARPHRRLVPVVVGVGALLAAAGVIAYVATRDVKPAAPVAVAPAPATAPAVAPPAPPTALAAVVVRELGRDANHPFDHLVHAGDTITTEDSRLDLQFDDASALALGPSSIVSVRRLDADEVELFLQQGTLDVTVTKRAPNQRFLVELATGRTVEVRGTQFRITETSTQSRVECAHGKVAVRDDSGEVEVGGARKLELGAHAPVAHVRPADLSATELKALVDATPLTMPVWPGAEALTSTSSTLELSAGTARAVRVDGIELGTAPLRVRVMPGRHTVETADRAGRFRRAGWIDASAGAPAHLDLNTDDAASSAHAAAAVARRKAQLLAALSRPRLATCTRAIAKSGLTDTFVQFEISIDELGNVQFLNIVDTDLPSSTASCVRDVLADVRFTAGPAATFRERVDL
jgi:hypothetical protein